MTTGDAVGVMQWWLTTLQSLARALESRLVLPLEERLCEARAALKEMRKADVSDQRVQQADGCALNLLAFMQEDVFDPADPQEEFVKQKQMLLALLNGGLIPKVILGMHKLAQQTW